MTPSSHPPTPPLPDPLYHQVTRFVNDRMGLHFPAARRADLERGLHRAAQEAGMRHTADYVAWLLSVSLSRIQIEELAGCLTIGETYFFRNPEQFTVLEQQVLPALIRQKAGGEKRLRIWCAGCSTGEEPYSVAISLRRVLPDPAGWSVTLLATDINGHFLRQAEAAVYAEWSFRNAPVWLKDGYFRRHGDGFWKLNADIRGMVTFEHLNLAEDPYPSLVNNTGAMDIIFCRNVLIYFDAANSKRVAAGFYRSLLDTGWLFVGPTDTFIYHETEFGPAEDGLITCYRKQPSGRLRPRPAELQPARVPVEKTPPPRPVHRPPTAAAPVRPSAHHAAAEAALKQAVELYQHGHYEQAVAFMEDALQPSSTLALAPEQAVPMMALLARVYANLGRLGASLEWCGRAIAKDKVNPGYHFLQATIYQERGELAAAREALKRTLFLDQTFVMAQFAMGSLTKAEGSRVAARRHLTNALDLLKQHPPEEALPEADGLTAGRLAELVGSMLGEMENA